MPRVEVGLLETIDEFRECERVQIDTWGGLAVSGETLMVTQKYGGAVVGTKVDGQVVGFIYAFLGRYRTRLAYWSHLMAVESRFRDHGFGLRMKLFHRQCALERNIKFICWTFDPLQSRNARLNIARLGGVVDDFIPNCYGQFDSLLEKGLPSDRFVIDWRIATSRVETVLRGDKPSRFDPTVPRVNETELTDEGFPKNQKIHLNLKNSRLLVEIPARTEEMRSRDLALGRTWRLEARQIFEHYFSTGYRVENFFAPQPATGDRCYYLLRRGSPNLLQPARRNP
jgi:predicted GNAT superfamily acetyltransferase